jgi:hypothetical protein
MTDDVRALEPDLTLDTLPGDDGMVLEPVADVIADDPWAASGWREAALDYHKGRGKRAGIVSYAPEEIARLRRLMDDGVSLECAWRELDGARNRPAPKSTVEALVFGLRKGVAALTHPDTQRRVSELDQGQLEDVCLRVQAFKPEIAPTWSAGDADLIIALWRKSNE